jgi:hypothetical protein
MKIPAFAGMTVRAETKGVSYVRIGKMKSSGAVVAGVGGPGIIKKIVKATEDA